MTKRQNLDRYRYLNSRQLLCKICGRRTNSHKGRDRSKLLYLCGKKCFNIYVEKFGDPPAETTIRGNN